MMILRTMCRRWGVVTLLVVFAALLSACGESEGVDESPVNLLVIDGELDCESADSQDETDGFGVDFDLDPDAVGAPTAQDALSDLLAMWDIDAELVQTSFKKASLVTPDGREVVIARASETRHGGWTVRGVLGCPGFEGPFK